MTQPNSISRSSQRLRRNTTKKLGSKKLQSHAVTKRRQNSNLQNSDLQCSHLYGPKSQCKLQVMYNKDGTEFAISKYCWIHTTMHQLQKIKKDSSLKKHIGLSNKQKIRASYRRTNTN